MTRLYRRRQHYRFKSMNFKSGIDWIRAKKYVKQVDSVLIGTEEKELTGSQLRRGSSRDRYGVSFQKQVEVR
jgi:hypothetical protein